MNQLKIGKFIAKQRKMKAWTQNQLAEHLGITSKAVSKWETGKSMPDVSLFLPLCELLDITLNELFLGENIPADKIVEKSEQVLIELISNWIGPENQMIKESNSEVPCVLNLEKVQKIYYTENITTKAIDNINLSVYQGSFIGIMGASGSGKTTLLNMIATIDQPTKGNIEINGENISKISEQNLAKFRRNHLGFVFQEYNLLDTLTIYENIALALTIKEVAKESIQNTISKLAVKLDIFSILDKYPYEVSGGQRQRCACARAIATNPSIILADEPTGALDSQVTKQLLESFCMLREEFDATILMVTHDALSASYCDEILFLEDGKIQSIIKRNHEPKQVFFSKILDVMEHLREA